MLNFPYSTIKKISILLLVLTCTVFITYLPVFAKGSSKASLTKNVEVETKDKVLIEGILELPKGATIKNKVPLVIMLHSLGSNKEIYNPLVEDFRSRGIASLRIDLRGHGQSIIRSESEKKTYWQQYADKEFEKYPKDVLSVIDFVKENFQQVNTDKSAIIAADLSANVAIIVGSQRNKSIKAMILLSPCMQYKTLKAPVQIVAYGNHPILFIVSKLDKHSYYQSTELLKYAQGKKKLEVLAFGGVGDRMLKLNPSTKPLIIKWLDENFIPQKKK
jgi:pimeloyl-ACP methyl ester carboxylesterase